MIARRILFGIVVGATILGVRTARAQNKPTPCELKPNPDTRLSGQTMPDGQQVVFAGGGLTLVCPSRGITLKGDSAEHYANREFMIGRVVFDDPRLHLTSDFLNYFPDEEKVIAVGNVNGKLPNGSTLVGPIAEYYRAVPRVRAHAQVRARSRPTITIVQKDSAGRPAADSTIVVGENVFMDGDSLMYASGQVVITRKEIGATADSVFLDQTTETMHLMRKPEIKGKKDKPYTLNGESIDLFSKDRKLQRVISRSNAVALSDSMTLKSDTIDLRVRNDLLDHAYAWGAGRATAVSPTQNLIADSLDVFMPAQKVREIHALKRAFAAGKLDTVRFRVERPDTTDWMRGDTITAHFDSLTAGDTTKAPTIRTLTASGNARSYYHMAASDSAERRPAINYVIGRQINIVFDKQLGKQKVGSVTVVDSVSGVYIEPRPDSTTRRTNARPATPTTTAPKTPPKTPPKNPPAAKPASTIPLPAKKP